nr:auxin responsive SAUR protein [Tanacetum cinerariifolium]
MVSLKKLVAMARKWQNLVAQRRKKISLPRAANCNDTTIVDKGCFVVYSSDRVRFMIPIDYLKNDIFQELLEMAEEEYGLQRDGPIRLPLKAVFMQSTISHIERQMSKEHEDELRITINSWKCLSTSNMQFEQFPTQLKWQSLVAQRRKRISLSRAVNFNETTIVDKGCFVVYTSDGVRFVIPIGYLKNDLFQELLEMAEEEYGLQRDGPIRLPLRADFMQYTISHIERQTSKELEEELRINITSWSLVGITTRESFCAALDLLSNPSSNPTPSINPNPKGRNRKRSKQRIEEFNLDELSPPIVTMVDQRTMAQLLQAPTEGYGDAIVVPSITADNFELKHGLLTLVQNKHFFRHDKEDPHAHIRYFNKITSTLNPDLAGERTPRSIFTWDDLVSKFINQFFPLSKTTNLRNEITNFQQRFDEYFSEAWDRFKDLLRACPHHGFSELHQLDTFYNALNSKDQDSLNSTVGGNFLDKLPRECLAIIESKSKVRYSRNKPVVAKVSTNTSTFGISPDVAKLKDMVKALLLDKKKSKSSSCYHESSRGKLNNQNRFNQNQNWRNSFNQGPVYQPSVFQPPAYQAPAYQAPAPQKQCVSKEDFSAYVKANDAVMRNMQTQGQNMQNQLTNMTDLLTKFVNFNNASTSSSGTLSSNTIANLRSDLKAITTRSVNSPTIELVASPVSAPMPNQRPSIPYPSRLQDQKLHDKANDQREKFFQIFKDLNFNISFADALILMLNVHKQTTSVTKLAAENNHLKQTYKQLFDSIKSSRVQSKEQCDDLINKVNLKSVEVADLNACLQEKVLVITALKEQLKGKAVLTKVVSLNPIDPALLKVDVVSLVPKLRKNRTTHIDYIKHTQEEAATLKELVESERLLSPLNTSLAYACKYTRRIQELLMILQQTCLRITDLGTNLVAVTPKNQTKQVRSTAQITKSEKTSVATSPSSNIDSNAPVLSSTGVALVSSASGS